MLRLLVSSLVLVAVSGESSAVDVFQEIFYICPFIFVLISERIGTQREFVSTGFADQVYGPPQSPDQQPGSWLRRVPTRAQQPLPVSSSKNYLFVQ